ncbi:MAG: hypothetical protein AAF927_19760 [Bacteroidota bacterium]
MNRFCLTFKGKFVSIREIIAARVIHEALQSQTLPSVVGPRLVEPLPIQRFLSGRSFPIQSQTVDVEKQVFRALDAFKTRAYVVFVDDIECKALDLIVKIEDAPDISFVIFQPLIG